MAERVGFEPTSRCNREPLFESGAISLSATSPSKTGLYHTSTPLRVCVAPARGDGRARYEIHRFAPARLRIAARGVLDTPISIVLAFGQDEDLSRTNRIG